MTVKKSMGLRASYLFSALIALTCLSSCASRDLFSSDSIARPLAAGLVNIILPEASCTGVQINALRAITAAHCLYNRKGGGVVSLEEIRVVKDVGPPHVSLRVSSAEMFPGFAIASRAVDNFNYDVAVLTFSDVMPGNFQNPNTLNIPLRLGDELATVYYKNVKKHLELVETPCSLLNRKKSVLVLDCPVDFGASGAPVYKIGRNGSSDLVAIIVAKAMWGRKRVALAVNVGSV